MCYLGQLEEGSIFSHNKYGETEVKLASLSENQAFISVITKIYNGIKGWGLAKISVEHEKFVHTAHGTFFTFEGATKKHCELIGKLSSGKDSIDDFC